MCVRAVKTEGCVVLLMMINRAGVVVIIRKMCSGMCGGVSV